MTRALLSDGGLPARGLGKRQGGGAGARRRSNLDRLLKLEGAAAGTGGGWQSDLWASFPDPP